ncbi:hypothetical protein [Cesiribacter andamanensis]|uniref:Uncharacterized protein n=1 Tax=Cesiribacter andamanensis AMV16 TaxID=1279009 RepID=M7NBR3_9BACT|nr:hypothetical protein [Cesiribacter andamanensis]EMR04626.1 hypothetical protein ADICEAN_00228 [Cesiribacter andamanensis AMV16]
MKRFLHPLTLLLLIFLTASCSRDKDPVVPAYTLSSHQGLIIQLEWTTGGSASQALYETDLDLYLDLGSTPIAASESLRQFEEVHLRDVYRDGTYDIYIGAIDVSRTTDYELNIFAPNGSTIHRFTGYFNRGEQGEVHYLRIRKQGPYYTLIDL